MDCIRLEAVAARVVAWHNRHPLARRIAPADVHSIGEVVLPFRTRASDASPTAAAAQPLRGLRRLDALVARVRRLRVTRRALPAFSEPFFEHLTPRAVAAWAEHHAAAKSIAPDDWPRRFVATDALVAARAQAKGCAEPLNLHLLTAAVGVGGRRLRLLLDAGRAIVGPRSYAPPRLLAAAGILGIAGSAAVLASGLLPAPTPRLDRTATVVVAAASPAASAVTTAAHANRAAAAVSAPSDRRRAHGPEIHDTELPSDHGALASTPPRTPSAPGAEGAIAAGQASPTAGEAASPTDAPPHGGHRDTTTAEARSSAQSAPATPAGIAISIRPPLSDEERRNAREIGRLLRAEVGVTKKPATATAAKPAAPPIARGRTVFALVAPPMRQRDQAQAVLARTKALEAMRIAPARSDVFEAQGRWRAALWPFDTYAAAERARVLLAGRGVKTQVVEF